MSGNSPTEYAATHLSEDNPNVKLSHNTQLVIENNSSDITISKCDPNFVSPELSANPNPTQLPLKAQVLPLVYIKNNNSKVPNRNTNNFIFSPVSTGNVSFMNKPNSSVSTISLNSNQNVIFAGRGRSLMLPKQPITIMPQGAKVAGTYVTMLKPVSKPEIEVSLQSENFCSNISGESIFVSQNPVPTITTQPQKFVLAGPLSKLHSTSVLAPMPKIQSNRLPVTATTNSLQATKFTVLPMPQKDPVNTPSPNVINFQISDGKIVSNVSTPVTIMYDSRRTNAVITDTEACTSEKSGGLESLDFDRSETNNKTYELSIAEESLSSQSDNKLIVSSAENTSSSGEITVVNKPTPKFAHGVSILKKNFIFPELKKPDMILNNAKSSMETDITIVKPSNGMEEKVIVTVPNIEMKKPEREKSRRKSQFSFRKDFDNMDIMLFPDSDPSETSNLKEDSKDEIKEEVKEEKCNIDDIKVDDGEVIQERTSPPIDPKTILDVKSPLDVSNLLTWEENVGSLPGSNLKFLLNEFGILEYLGEEDYRKILDKKQKKIKEKEDMEREVQCVECSCYGIRADFINTNFCSFDCQEISKSFPAKKNLDSAGYGKGIKRKFGKTKSENETKDSNEPSGEEENSNDTSQEKFAYPWACKKKGFSWSKYLIHVSARAAPVKLFKDPFPYTRNGFKSGMKLEGVDPQHPSYFCVLSVMDTIGYRIRLHFDGYPENYDFWINADSLDIFPMGWCEKYGHVLRPPPGYTEENFNWLQYLKLTKSTAAPKHLFVNRAGQAICPNGFRIGMKLEAVDKKNSALICVATVRDMMDNRILVHFDGWDDIYDYWADPTSPHIHPVGWCDQYGHDLTPPSDYPTPASFTWEKYLKETKSVAAPVRAFKQRPACGFKRGMRLECVDKRVPHLIRVATVDDVREHQIRIHFDGWIDRYSYWVDDDSPDIHPVGWCQKTGHPLEPPLTPDEVYGFLECPTVGCRGQGHVNGMKYSTHSSEKFCPYSEQNIDTERSLPDRLLSPDRSPEAKEPVSRQAKDYKAKPRIGRPPKWLKELEASKPDKNNEPPEKRPKRRYTRRIIKKEDDDFSKTVSEEKAKNFIDQSKILPAERESWKKHSEFLNDYINSGENPLTWSFNDVVEFVNGIPGCDSYANSFKHHRIDGESFLQLNQSDIMQILCFKVGPAVKLYNSIVLLREQFCDTKSRK